MIHGKVFAKVYRCTQLHNTSTWWHATMNWECFAARMMFGSWQITWSYLQELPTGPSRPVSRLLTALHCDTSLAFSYSLEVLWHFSTDDCDKLPRPSKHAYNSAVTSESPWRCFLVWTRDGGKMRPVGMLSWASVVMTVLFDWTPKNWKSKMDCDPDVEFKINTMSTPLNCRGATALQ